MKQLDNKYDFKKVEEGKYQEWLKNNYFVAEGVGSKKEPFSIVIPPPNVTGTLHLGHAWDTTLSDIIVRYKRMSGYDTLWLPGMDHAGIATQAKVEERLKKDGISKYDIGKEEFLKISWQWKEEYAKHIHEQWTMLGLSLDYSRERFTLDEGLSEAVKKVFVSLYNEGLIYRGERIINWDVEANTALSNIEVIHKDIEGKFYTFKYKLVDSDEFLLVSTTRPETMYGDVCVVVNPNDKRYQTYIGKKVINPANNEEIPIIADEYVDVEFGTGAMKCTPAHDPNDFELAKKHNLAKILCMNSDGTMNERAQEFEGFERFECRKQLVAKLDKLSLLDSIETITHSVGHSERTDTIIEPYMSLQWFVKMKPLAEEVINQQNKSDEKITFYPERFEKTFSQWLENIEDWCISRQLWWGHQIPAWYHKTTGEIYVGEEPPHDSENYLQDEDVLDTWFSSALWPFSTLGWPTETADYKRYYPTSALVTGYDIIFFWVARMAFQARHFTGSRPFKDVLIHGLIRDSEGKKMSKSLGNGVDPRDVIDKYGVDALRFFLTTNSTPGQDMRFIEEKVEAASNFINKIWNATRFVLLNLDENMTLADIDLTHISTIDAWIIKRFNETLTSINHNMDKYEFALVGNELYKFIWDDYCSWYIELSKASLNGTDLKAKQATQSTLVLILLNSIKLLHPFMPFVSEEIYQALPHKEDSICISSWPTVIEGIRDVDMASMNQLLSIIQTIREIKVDYKLKPSTPITIMIKDQTEQVVNLSALVQDTLVRMAKATCVEAIDSEVLVRPISGGSLLVPMSEIVDIEMEISKLKDEQETLNNEITRANKMLSNEQFVAKAPKDKIEAEQSKLAGYTQQLEIVTKQLNELLERVKG